MSILVTGGAGYIGSHMVLELLDAGEDVVVLDNLSTGFRHAVPDEADFIKGDVGDARLLLQTIASREIDVVVHFAGSIVVPDSVADPLGYYLNNTVKSRTLIAAAITGGIKHFIFSSTAAVYGMPEASPVAEDAPLKPISPYGSSKMMTEIMLADTAQAHDFAYVALRYFNVAGADPAGRAGQSTPNATHLIKLACQTALGERPRLEVFGTDYATPDGSCVRDYIHVSDLVRAHLAALDHLRTGGASAVLNCGYGTGHSVLEVIDAVERCAGKALAVRKSGRRAGDAPELVAANAQILDRLKWRPRHDDLDEIITHALAWERELIRYREAS